MQKNHGNALGVTTFFDINPVLTPIAEHFPGKFVSLIRFNFRI
jgi:hypothetical protein